MHAANPTSRPRRLARALASPLAPFALALALPLAATLPASAQATFCEQDGLIVMEVESAPLAGNWVAETSKPGYSGSTYYRWAGPNQFTNPGQGVLTWTLNVTTPGKYSLRLRNLHDNTDSTVENDCWARLDGGAWVKVYSPNTSVDWNWASWFDPATGSDSLASWVLAAGTHTFQVSGRSWNFRVDRIHFFLDGTPFPQGLFHPESFCAQAWEDLDGGLPGAGGLVPLLAGTGDLSAGSDTTLSLTQAAPASAASLVIGLSPLGAPFKGGVMVPELDVLVTGLQTAPSGGLALGAAWPAGLPGGTALYLQFWVADPAAPEGFAASNGLKATTP